MYFIILLQIKSHKLNRLWYFNYLENKQNSYKISSDIVNKICDQEKNSDKDYQHI